MKTDKWICVTLLVSLVLLGGCEKKRRVNLEAALAEAVRAGDVSRVQTLIVRGANVNTDVWYAHGSPLHAAAYHGHLAVAKVLIACGAHVNASDRSGQTALHLAARAGHADVAVLLIDSGADINGISWRPSDNEGSPLHSAVQGGHLQMVQLLIGGGADINVRDADGRTPAALAMEEQQRDMLELLIRSGAEVTVDMAAYIGDTARVQSLLQDGADVNARASDGCTALHQAVLSSHRDVVEILLRAGADVRVKNGRSDLPLHYAASAGSQIVDLLLRAGADVHAKDGDGDTALHHAAAAQVADPNTIRLLLDAGADINAGSLGRGTPLMRAARAGHPTIVELLVARGADIKARDKYGQTALHAAAEGKQPAVAEFLLARGADINAADRHGGTALHEAASSYTYRWTSRNWPAKEREAFAQRMIETVKVLLKHDPNLQGIDGNYRSVLGNAVDSGCERVMRLLIEYGADPDEDLDLRGTTLLLKAARDGNTSLVEFLLDHGARTDIVPEDGDPPLHRALRERQAHVVELLIAHGVDVNQKNPRGVTPLHRAAIDGQAGSVSLLLAKGAEVNARDDGDDTPLHSAALRGHKEVVGLLLTHGADGSVKNSRGRTPLDEAIRRDHSDIFRLLRAAQAQTPAGATQKRE